MFLEVFWPNWYLWKMILAWHGHGSWLAVPILSEIGFCTIPWSPWCIFIFLPVGILYFRTFHHWGCLILTGLLFGLRAFWRSTPLLWWAFVGLCIISTFLGVLWISIRSWLLQLLSFIGVLFSQLELFYNICPLCVYIIYYH